jgi:hypothetical protein
MPVSVDLKHACYPCHTHTCHSTEAPLNTDAVYFEALSLNRDFEISTCLTARTMTIFMLADLLDDPLYSFACFGAVVVVSLIWMWDLMIE